jgi:hypothetical protein
MTGCMRSSPHLVEQVEANVQGIPDENESDCDDGGSQLGSSDLGNEADERRRDRSRQSIANWAQSGEISLDRPG